MDESKNKEGYLEVGDNKEGYENMDEEEEDSDEYDETGDDNNDDAELKKEKVSKRKRLRNLTKEQRQILWSLAIMHFVLYSTLPLCAPIFPVMARSKGLRPWQTGWIMGLSWLVMFCVSPFFGSYIFMIGPKLMLLGGMFITGLSTVGFGLLVLISDEAVFLGVAIGIRIVEGLGVAAFTVAANAIAAAEMQDLIQIIMGILMTVQGIAVIIAPPIGGLLYKAAGYILPFALTGGIIIVATPLNALVLKSLKATPPEDRQALSIWALLKDGAAFVIVLNVAVFTTAFKFIEFYTALYVNFQFNYGPLMAGVILSVACVSFAVSAIFWAKAAKKVGGKVVMFAASCLGCTACFFIGPFTPLLNLWPHSWLYFLMVFMLGAALSGGLVPAVPELLKASQYRDLPDNYKTYGIVSASYGSAYDIGCFLGPILGGPMYSFIGFPWATAIFSGLIFLTGIALMSRHLYEVRRAKQEGEDTHLMGAIKGPGKPKEEKSGVDVDKDVDDSKSVPQ